MCFLDKPTLSADNGSFFQKNLVYQTEKPTLSEINLLYLIIVTTACHKRSDVMVPDFPLSGKGNYVVEEFSAKHLRAIISWDHYLTT